MKMKCELYSRKLKKTLTFSIPGASYVYVDINGQPGTLGRQICTGGCLMGSTISFYGGDGKEKFQAMCKNWLRQYLKKY
jgi:hypothetical protein